VVGITPADQNALLRGLELMGTGGGGTAEFGRAIMDNDFRQGRSYSLVRLDEVPPDALVVSGGIMGSVKELDEPSPAEIVQAWESQFEAMLALEAMERHLGRKVDYLIPFELGGLNTPVIMSLGSRAGIPVLDADGVGRAAPETQMSSFIGHGIELTPMPLVDWKRNTVIVETAATPFFPDEVGRIIISRAGGMGANAHYPMRGAEAARAAIPGTISFTLRLGKKLEGITDPESASKLIADELNGKVCFTGRVKALRQSEATGFFVQRALLEGSGQYSGHSMEVLIKNEFMMASLDGEVGCVFPDLILLVNDRGRGMMSAELAEGDQVHMVIAPCHPRLRQAAASAPGMEAMSPARFGAEGVPYRPVEELSSAWGLKWED